MTDIQKVSFELLREFIRICDQLELEYFLVCGSALGAVKMGRDAEFQAIMPIRGKR